MKKFIVTVCLSLVLLVTGCASNPGMLQRSEAVLGSGTFYYVEPGYVLGSKFSATSRLFLGLQYNTDWDKSLFFVVRTEVQNAEIPDTAGLVVIADGERIEIDAPMSITSTSSVSKSSFSVEKKFSSTTDDLKKMLSAKNLIVEVDIGRGVIQGDLLIDGEQTAIRGLRDFAKQIGL